jgi:hypothetical protein
MDCLSRYFDENIKKIELYSFDSVSCLIKCPLCNGNVCPYIYVSYIYEPPEPQIKLPDSFPDREKSYFTTADKDKLEYIWNMCRKIGPMEEKMEYMASMYRKINHIEEKVEYIIEKTINEDDDESSLHTPSTRKRKKRTTICKTCGVMGHYAKSHLKKDIFTPPQPLISHDTPNSSPFNMRRIVERESSSSFILNSIE